MDDKCRDAVKVVIVREMLCVMRHTWGVGVIDNARGPVAEALLRRG